MGSNLPRHATNVATAPGGSSYENERPPSVTLNACGGALPSQSSFTAMIEIEPSGLRNATSWTVPAPVVEPIRTAPGRTNFVAWPRTYQSAVGVARPVRGSIVTTPKHVPQPPLCGPPEGSSARFQVMTVFAQLRIAPTVRLAVCQCRVSGNVVAGSADWEPKHSVK